MVEVLDRSVDLRKHEDELYNICSGAQAAIDEKQPETERFKKVLLVYAGAEIAKEHGFSRAPDFEALTGRISTYHPANWFGYVFSEGSDHLRRQGLIATRDPNDLLNHVIDTQDALFEHLDRDDYTEAPHLLSRLHTAERIALGHKLNTGAEIQSIVRDTYRSIDKNMLIAVLVPGHIEPAKNEMRARYQ